MLCRCRMCHSTYDDQKATADWTGYCTLRCQHDKARQLGFRRHRRSTDCEKLTEYEVLSRAMQIGSVPLQPPRTKY